MVTEKWIHSIKCLYYKRRPKITILSFYLKKQEKNKPIKSKEAEGKKNDKD